MSCATVRVGASCMLFTVSTGRVIVGVVGMPRVFPVRMPSGERYWTLLDDDLELVVAAEEFLRHLRFGRDAAESTTRTYAGGIALFLRWCALTGRDWRTAAGYLGMFMLWLRHAETGGDVVVPGPGTKAVRGPRRVNSLLAAVREFVKRQVIAGAIDAHVMAQLAESLVAEQVPGLLVIRSLTKTWGIAGLRAGYVLGDPDLVRRLAAHQPPWSVSSPALAAIQACCSDRARQEAEAAARVLTAHRRVLVAGLADLGLPVAGTPRTPFVLVDTRSVIPAGGSAGYLRDILRDNGFAVRRGDTFPGLGPEWVRIAVREPAGTRRLLQSIAMIRAAERVG